MERENIKKWCPSCVSCFPCELCIKYTIEKPDLKEPYYYEYPTKECPTCKGEGRIKVEL